MVDLDALETDPPWRGGRATRLVPKVLVGTQGRVVEAVVDEDGRLLPSVPTLTVAAPRSGSGTSWPCCWRHRSRPTPPRATPGPRLTMRSVKLSATQVAALPLPTDAARLGRRRGAPAGGAAGRRPPVRTSLRGWRGSCAAAYAVDDRTVLGWWLREGAAHGDVMVPPDLLSR